MRTFFLFASFFCLVLIFNPGCLQNDYSHITEPEPEPFFATCSTTVLGTVPPYVNIEFDSSAFYFFDEFDFKICKIEKTSGVIKCLNTEPEEKLRDICLGEEYLYMHGGEANKSVYRVHKSLNSSYKLLVSFENPIGDIKAGGNCLYIEFRKNFGSGENDQAEGFFLYDIQKDALIKIHNRNSWFDIDKDNVYWITIDTVSNEKILLKKPHHVSTPTVLLKGDFYADKMIDEYIYVWDEDRNLKRISKHNGSVENVLSSPVGFTDDNGYVVLNNIVYTTDCYGATLSGIPLNNAQNELTVIEKRGRFDDDDMNCWLWTDNKALFWVAGPAEGTLISDEQWGTLFKTYVNKK